MAEKEAKEEAKKTTLSLASKLAQIGREIGRVNKTGRNAQQNYAFIEYAEVAGRIRDLLAEYNVIIVPKVESVESQTISNKYNSTGFHYMLSMRFDIINGDKPDETIASSWRGESTDFGDKGINKAETSACKYFLMRLFNISEKGEEETDSKSPEITRVERQPKRVYTDEEIDNIIAEASLAQTAQDLQSFYDSVKATMSAADVQKILPAFQQRAAEIKREKGE